MSMQNDNKEPLDRTPLGMNRRGFIRASAAAASGLFISLELGCATTRAVRGPGGSFQPNAWLQIHPDDTIRFILDRVEMGQGTTTSHVMLLAEELEVDPARILVEPAPADAAYNNTLFMMQSTGGSTSVRSSYESLRQAGAATREMLKGAAAQRWGVPVQEITAADGVMHHQATNSRATYGELAAEAADVPAPDEVKLKPPSSWKRLGKPVQRLDARGKVDGSGVYGMDFQRPNMRYAVVVRCPVFGGTIVSYDDTKVKAHKGVEATVQLDNGIAVVADSYWTARRASQDLVIKWNEGKNATLSSKGLTAEYAKLAEEPGKEVHADGDVEAALKDAAQTIDAVYEVPYLAHATMEPMNATAEVNNGKVQVWVGCQAPDMARALAAQVAEVSIDDVQVHGTLLGGGFGRRGTADYVVEAVGVAKQVPHPVKVVFSREDDTQTDFYRPMAYNVFQGAVDKSGKPSLWRHRIVGQSTLSGAIEPALTTLLPDWTPGVIAAMAGGSIATAFDNAWVTDMTVIEGAAEVPYKIGAWDIDVHIAEPHMPVGFWRSVGSSENGFVVESFIDELAHLGGQDPFKLRQELLPKGSRERGVLEKVAAMSGWEKGPPPGRHFGIAQHKSFNSYAAAVIEIEWKDDAGPGVLPFKITRAWTAIDCGRVLNPDMVKTQMEGGLIFGLSAAMKQKITLENGRVVQSNFHDYGTLRMNEAPDIEVGIIESDQDPTGVGEPGVPCAAPALCNAIYAASKKRIRRLPIEEQFTRPA